MPVKKHEDARATAPLPLPAPADRRRFRQRLLTWYRPPRPRSAVAQDRRPVPHPRVRDHAAADAGRSRAAEVRRVARQISVVRRARRGARAGRHRRPGIRSATTSGRSGCRRSRARRSRDTAASCRPTRRRCCRSRASAPTRPARSAASRSASAPRFSTPTSRACCSASSSATGDPKSHAMKRHLWTLSETLVPVAPGVRFQPGADGLRRDGLRRAQPEVPGLPDGEELPRYPFTPDRQVTHDRRDRGGRSSATAGSWSRAGRQGVAPRGLLGISRRQMRPGRVAGGVPRARAARGARRRRGRARECSRRPRLSGSPGRAAFLRVTCSAIRGRCSVRRCGGCGATSSARWSFRRPTRS